MRMGKREMVWKWKSIGGVVKIKLIHAKCYKSSNESCNLVFWGRSSHYCSMKFFIMYLSFECILFSISLAKIIFCTGSALKKMKKLSSLPEIVLFWTKNGNKVYTAVHCYYLYALYRQK